VEDLMPSLLIMLTQHQTQKQTLDQVEVVVDMKVVMVDLEHTVVPVSF
tara:strand:- start:47 stop:190 length:144 start_codon:yes stop_codon:yes gene_type:complete